MSKEELSVMKVENLRKLCKEKGISIYVGKNRITKAEMIEKLTVESQKEVDSEKERKASKMKKYVEEVEPGTIVAFYDKTGKPRTAKVIAKRMDLRRLKVETEFGAQFVVPFEKVMWVKYGTRWPKGVFDVLKGRIYEQTANSNN